MELENLKICNICESENIILIDKDNNLCKCKDCGYIFDNPRPVSSEVIKFYSRLDHYDPWLAEEKAWNLLWQRRLEKVKKYKDKGTLLDVGAGIGQFLYFAQNNFDVRGTEVSESAVRTAKQKYNINLIPGKIEDIDFGGLKFDVITLFHVLEHLPNPSIAIKKCKELLDKEGIIIVTVPNDIDSLEAKARSFLATLKIAKWKKRGKFGLPKITLDGSKDEIHLSHFTPPVLKMLLTRNGFTVIEDTLDPYYPVRKYKSFFDNVFYALCLFIKKILGKNVYDTIWIVAEATPL